MLVAVAVAQQSGSAGPQAPSKPAPQVASTNVSERVQSPTYSDVYCAGFLSTAAVPTSTFVTGGLATPHQTKFADRDYVYLSGSGFQVGSRYTILRELRDPNRREVFIGQRALLGGLGEAYAELGRVRVVGVNGNIGITVVEFNCDTMVPGDVAVPFREKPQPAFRGSTSFDRFAPPNGKLAGRIVMAKDFDSIVGTGQKVYLNVGADQGVKVGDYFRAVRTYDSIKKDEVDALSYKASQTEDTQKNPPALSTSRIEQFPRVSLGEMVVLDVTPKSATAMITFALEDIHLGDGVEMEEAPPPAAVAPPPVAHPPTIACSANPATVRPGETSTISCEASSPDNRPLTLAFAADRGQLMARDSSAVLNTRNLEPGPVSVKSTVSDDRNLTAMALTTVNVEAPPPAPTASKLNEIHFKPHSAYVNNTAKAILDDVALRLQREPNSSAAIVGLSDKKEAKTLAARRARNAKAYLTRGKGIDPKRVQVRSGAETGKKADIWMVPAGASMPQ